MMEKFSWFDVVLDYGKRFPDITWEDFEINDNHFNFKISKLHCSETDDLYYHLRDENNHIVLSSTEKMGKGVLEYIDNQHNWIKVPDNILLRLLTEGKEDLI